MTRSGQLLSRSSFLRSLACGFPALCAVALPTTSAQPAAGASEAMPDLANLRTFLELARSDIRTQKALILAENISFTQDEAIEFWPLHREYELELGKLQDHRLDLIRHYASQFQSMTNSEATKLANDVFELEAKRTTLKRKYFKKFSKVVPPLKAARFFQIENQLNMVLDLQIAAALPLIK